METISFDQAVSVRSAGDRRYSGAIHPSWDGPLTTHGGILAAIGLSAIETEVNAERATQVRSLTCQFLRPPKHGELEVVVEPLRAGRRISSSRALISQDDRVLISMLATHSARGMHEAARWSPNIPAANPAPSRDAARRDFATYRRDGGGWVEMPEQAPPYFHRVLIAPQFGDPVFAGPPADDGDGTENGGWLALPEARPIDPTFLTFCVDAFWPSVFQPLRELVAAPTLDLTIHYRAELPPEGLVDQPLLVHNRTVAMLGGLADSDSRVFSTDGSLLAQARQLQLVTPISS
ncbi:MAG: thioesterase family protein [Solirubrobacterales bacterium]